MDLSKSILNTRNIFTFGAFSHAFLSMTIILTQIDLYEYIFGHVFVTLAFSEKSRLELIPSMKTTILGVLGHFSLFFMFFNKVFLMNPYNLKSIIYLLGQIGMISYYIFAKVYANEILPLYANMIIYTAFIFLTIFYISEGIKLYDKYPLVCFSKSILIVLYGVLFLNHYNKQIKNKKMNEEDDDEEDDKEHQK